ncbi:hypothetical protein MKX01_020812, partial [Papaver californicum]
DVGGSGTPCLTIVEVDLKFEQRTGKRCSYGPPYEWYLASLWGHYVSLEMLLKLVLVFGPVIRSSSGAE